MRFFIFPENLFCVSLLASYQPRSSLIYGIFTALHEKFQINFHEPWKLHDSTFAWNFRTYCENTSLFCNVQKLPEIPHFSQLEKSRSYCNSENRISDTPVLQNFISAKSAMTDISNGTFVICSELSQYGHFLNWQLIYGLTAYWNYCLIYIRPNHIQFRQSLCYCILCHTASLWKSLFHWHLSFCWIIELSLLLYHNLSALPSLFIWLLEKIL